MTNVEFLVHLHELVVQVFPRRSLDALVDGLANCVPRMAAVAVLMSAEHLIDLFEVSIRPHSRSCVGCSLLKFGQTTLIASEFFSRSQPRDCPHIRKSFMMFNLICSYKPSNIVSTRLSPPVCLFANNLTLGAWARNTFASLGSAAYTTMGLSGTRNKVHFYRAGYTSDHSKASTVATHTGSSVTGGEKHVHWWFNYSAPALV